MGPFFLLIYSKNHHSGDLCAKSRQCQIFHRKAVLLDATIFIIEEATHCPYNLKSKYQTFELDFNKIRRRATIP
jgi:hypothetical protein